MSIWGLSGLPSASCGVGVELRAEKVKRFIRLIEQVSRQKDLTEVQKGRALSDVGSLIVAERLKEEELKELKEYIGRLK